MKRAIGLAILGLMIVLPALVTAEGVVEGNWRLTTLAKMGTEEKTDWLFNLKTIDGKTTASLVSANPAFTAPELVSFTLKDNQVRIVVGSLARQVFEGRVNPDGKKIVGVIGSDKPGTPINAAYLVPTKLNRLEANDVTTKLNIEPLDRATQLTSLAATLQDKALKTKDADERVDLLQEAKEAKKKESAEVPKLYLETIEKYPQTIAAGQAALGLLNLASLKAGPDELKNWAQVASRSASEFGTRWSTEINMQVANALAKRKLTGLAGNYALAAEKTLDDTLPKDLQLNVFTAVHRALLDADNNTERQRVEERLTNLEKIVDEDYLKTVPSFRGTQFAGRKGPSDRTVLMELFTGAQCPPCVASDVAFDVLQQTYQPTELVLIQYHVHIPGPDPMTNPDTEARWTYYRAASKEVTGAPTAVFAGKPQRSGGGAMAAADKVYKVYRNLIDPLLEEPAGYKIAVTAKRQEDMIHVEAQVDGVQKPGMDMRLRLALVEECIRFQGGNGIRYHHQVVRAMPGGAQGTAIKGAGSTVKYDLDVGQLRKQLVGYLDGYQEKIRPFPQLHRPMSMRNLRVIAFVQDEVTHEILQVAQDDVR